MSNKKGRFSKRRRSGTERAVIICLILLIALLAGLIGWTLLNRGQGDADAEKETQPAETDAYVQTNAPSVPMETTAPPETEPKIPSAIPCTVAEGKLQISSLFEYSGSNPDCDWENGENICGMVLENISNEHLVYARIELEMSDGSLFLFEAEQIPAGETVWVFERNNQSLITDTICVSVVCTQEFEKSADLRSEILDVEISGMKIRLTNKSKEELQDVSVTCHSALDDFYFGGLAYTYHAGDISAGEAVDIIAIDCFMDSAAVISIDVNETNNDMG